MRLSYFAGAIFTTQILILYCTIAFLLASMVLGTLVYIVSKLLNKFAPPHPKTIGFVRSLILAVAVIGVTVLGVFVLPTMTKDNSWRNKQAACAQRVGYADPQDDNSNKATAESQAAYRQCLGF